MRRKALLILSFLFVMVLCLQTGVCAGTELIPQAYSQMADISIWNSQYGGKLFQAKDGTEEFLHCYNILQSWHSPSVDLYRFIVDDAKKNGGGKYMLSYWVAVDLKDNAKTTVNSLIRGNRKNDFLKEPNGNETEWRGSLGRFSDIKSGVWYSSKVYISVTSEGLLSDNVWNFCFDGIDADNVESIYLDNFKLSREGDAEGCAVTGFEYQEIGKVNQKTNATNTSQKDASPGKQLLYLDFENGKVPASVGKFSCDDLKFANGDTGKCLYCSNLPNSWSSPSVDLSSYIKTPGVYSIGLDLMFDVDPSGATEGAVSFIVRGTRANSFIAEHGANYFGQIMAEKYKSGEWKHYETSFAVEEEDLAAPDKWILCISALPQGVKAVCIDNIELAEGGLNGLSGTSIVKTAELELSEVDIIEGKTTVISDTAVSDGNGSVTRPEKKPARVFDRDLSLTVRKSITYTVLIVIASVVICIQADNIKRLFRFIFKRRKTK